MEDIVSSSVEIQSVVLFATGVGVANQREDTCRFGEYETPERNWVYFFNCGNVSVGQSYQITIVILWWPVSNDTGYGKKRLNRENPHPSYSSSRRINDYPKLKLYQEFQWVEYSLIAYEVGTWVKLAQGKSIKWKWEDSICMGWYSLISIER